MKKKYIWLISRILKIVNILEMYTSFTAFKASSLCWTDGYNNILWNKDSKTGRRDPTLPTIRTSSTAILEKEKFQISDKNTQNFEN